MTAVMADAVLDEVEQRIEQVSTPSRPHPVQVAAAHATVGGKLLRPRLLIAAAGPSADRQLVVEAAVAIEVLHAALLVHDDVIDGDDERRGRPSIIRAASADASAVGLPDAAARRLGLTTAIVAGDTLLVRAVATLGRMDLPAPARVRLLDIVERAMIRAAEGEHDDVLFAGREADTAAVQRVMEGKTAEYSFCAPLELGAELGGRGAAAIADLRGIGMSMGVIYQLRDDTLGVFGDEARTGKSVLSDIRAGAPTLLASIARQSTTWMMVSADYGDPAADYQAAERIRRIMRESGALDAVERRISLETERTRADIDAAEIDDELRMLLRGILDRCSERTR